jgi:hypothetical protein
MSSVTPETDRRRTSRKNIMISAVVIVVLVIGLLIAVPFITSSSVSHPKATCTMPNGEAGTFDAVTGSCISFTVVITHQEQNFVNVRLLADGFKASCYVFCHGITYTLDPTVITNGGHNFEQCKIFGAAGTGDGSTCTAADFAKVVGLSLSAAVPAATDNWASAGPCKTGSEIIAGGLTDVAGTVTSGAAGTTVTTQIANTFTAAETDTAVQAACLQTELHSGGNVVMYAEGTFGPDTLVSGNTLTITWSIART